MLELLYRTYESDDYMSIERAKAHLAKYGLDGKVMEFSESSATVELAAQAVGCEPAMIIKTLSFDINGTPTLIMASGDMKIDNTKFKAMFHTKAKMLTYDEVEKKIGHAVGGVCPFGINDGVSVYLDASVKRFEKSYPACGSSNSAIGLTVPELEACSGYIEWIDVCKGIA